jgi:hypothetical protein
VWSIWKKRNVQYLFRQDALKEIVLIADMQTGMTQEMENRIVKVDMAVITAHQTEMDAFIGMKRKIMHQK